MVAWVVYEQVLRECGGGPTVLSLTELYTALCLLWGVDEIKGKHAVMLAEAVLEVINEQA